MITEKVRKHLVDEWFSILESLTLYKYGAVIEVTNGHYARRKKRQKEDIMRFLRRISKTCLIKFEYGLAATKSSPERLKSLRPSFRIDMPYPDPVLLREASIHTLDSDYILPKDKFILEKILGDSERNGMQLNHLLNTKKSSETNCIRGAVAEMYFFLMLDSVMSGKWRRMFGRQKYIGKDGIGDIDILVACAPATFRDALDLIEKKYRKVKIQYPYKKS